MSGKEDGWTEVGRSGARPDLESNEPQQPSDEELEKNPFSQLGETDDPSTDLTAATEDAAGKAGDSAEESGQEAGEIVQEGTEKAAKAAGNLKERSQALEDGTGFGKAGKDADVKAPVADKDDSLPEEYGAADDEFVTRTNYPPSEPVQKSYLDSAKDFVAGVTGSEPSQKSYLDSAKDFVAGVTGSAGGEDVGPGTLVSMRNKIAGMDD